MSKTWNKHGWKMLGLALALALANPAGVMAQQTAGCCQMFCCPHNSFCQEGPPRICFHCGCPRPTVNPCTQPSWGYYQPCVSPWPFPPDWSHCPVQPPASLVFPPLGPPVSTPGRAGPRATNPEMLPSPNPIGR